MKNIFGVLLLVLLPGLEGINFAQPAPAGEIQTGRPSSTNSTTTTTTACFQCGGAGQVKCTGPDCKDGMVECTGPCLKLSKGTWEHLVVAGHDPEELWQKFNQSDGSWQAWNQGHLGEVIEMQEGKAVNVGKCKVCAGAGKIKCGVCNGTGLVVCPTCGGKKVVSSSWTAFNNPKLKNPPKTIRFKDGRTLVGKIEMRLGSKVFLRTEDGKQLEVEAAELAPESAGQPAPH